jgi:hypothetical protein
MGNDAGEPSIGATPDGTALTQSYATTYRTTWDAAGNAQWSDVTPPHGLGVNLDPILATDPATGDTLAGGLLGPCTSLWRTSDAGATWGPVADACTGPAVDHETVALGPLPAPLSATPLRAAYVCAQGGVIACSASLDGGVTFGAPVLISPGVSPQSPTRYCTGPSGHVKVASDGAVYVPSGHCQTQDGVMVSTDAGATWTTRILPGSTVPVGGFDPSVATSASGWVYAAYEDQRMRQIVQVSHDQGATWSAPADVGAPAGLRATTFGAVAAGDDLRAAVAFLGTTDAGKANDISFAGAWDLYVAFTYDGGATWQTVKASADPVQYGWICSAGVGCPGHRNLLDFLDATVDPQGRVLVAYADGCPPGCASVAQSTASKLTIARQGAGLGLRSAFDP